MSFLLLPLDSLYYPYAGECTGVDLLQPISIRATGLCSKSKIPPLELCVPAICQPHWCEYALAAARDKSRLESASGFVARVFQKRYIPVGISHSYEQTALGLRGFKRCGTDSTSQNRH